MDYYEELGVSREATAQEIRRAYKVLARLVHPDGQHNKQLRAMAHRQMQRANQIVATLTNERKRREYDRRLDAAAYLGPGSEMAVLSRPSIRPRSLGWRDVIRWWNDPKPWQTDPEWWFHRLPVWSRLALQNWFWISLFLILVSVALWYLAQDGPDLQAAVARQLIAGLVA